MLLHNEARSLKWVALLTGFSTIFTQVVLLREFLYVFHGNELVIGILLANWMILTGSGSLLYKAFKPAKASFHHLIILLIVMVFLPLLTLFGIAFLDKAIFLPGISKGPGDIFLISFLALIPFCLLSGYLFTFVSVSYHKINIKRAVINTYYFESAGSIGGGLIISLLLLYATGTVLSLLILMMAGTIIVIVLVLLSPLRKKWHISVAVALLCCTIIFMNPSSMLDDIIMVGKQVISRLETPYGRVEAISENGQINIYENGMPAFSDFEPEIAEEMVHFAMIQHSHPADILIISGSPVKTFDELKKYNIRNVDYIRINKAIPKLAEDLLGMELNKNINIISRDARLYLNDSKQDHYDVILSNMLDPGTVMMNRYFTLEFFTTAERLLKGDGVLMVMHESTANYAGDLELELNSVTYNTLKEVFKYVLIIPGGKNYFLASNNPLDINVIHKLKEKGIDNSYVNEFYFEDSDLSSRNKILMDAIDDDTRINTDMKPVSSYIQLKLWVYRTGMKNWWVLIIFAFSLLFIIIRLNTLRFSVFIAGFSSSALEFLSLVVIQALYGYVYQLSGLAIAIFMAGLATGSFIARKSSLPSSYKKQAANQILIGIIILVFPVMISLFRLHPVPPLIMNSIILVLLFLMATFSASLFCRASLLKKEETGDIASGLYSSDLVGAAIGILLTSVVIFPLLGLWITCLILFGINLITASLLYIRN